MFVIKRDGSKQNVHFDKITTRIRKLMWGFDNTVDPTILSQKICGSIYSGVTTRELDELVA